MDCKFSKASASFIKIPFCAATPVPTIIEVGVASPRAQGQAITKTETAFKIPRKKSFAPKFQIKKVSSAIKSTAGTNTALTLSTMRCTGAFPA